MTDRYQQLCDERARAKAALDVSPAWLAWRTADAALRSSPDVDVDVDRLFVPASPVLVPEQVVELTDGWASWDEQDVVLLEYMRVRRAEELRERLVSSGEWQSFHAAQQRLLAFAQQQLANKKEALERRRVSSSRVQPHSLLPPPQPSASQPPQAVTPADATGAALLVIAPVVPSSTSHVPADALVPPSSTPPPAEHSLGSSASSSQGTDAREPPSPTTAATSVPSSAQHAEACIPSTSSSNTSSSSTNLSGRSTPVSVASSGSISMRRESRRSSSLSRSPPRASSGKLKQPEWCREMVEDGHAVLHAHQLGLVNQDVRDMCGSVRPQVQRIWSDRGLRSLLAALVTARHFTPASWSHPTHQQMDDIRQRVYDAVELWSEQQFASVLSGREKAGYVSECLSASSEGQLDLSFLRLFQAVDPTHPTVYVISVSSHHDGDGHASLDTIAHHHESDSNTPSIVLYRHVSFGSHFEAVSWKPSRGGTPLNTSFTRSHDLIVALERWKRGGSAEADAPPSLTRKRKLVALDAIHLEQDEPDDGASLSQQPSAPSPPL